jgi:hypothetical protein
VILHFSLSPALAERNKLSIPELLVRSRLKFSDHSSHVVSRIQEDITSRLATSYILRFSATQDGFLIVLGTPRTVVSIACFMLLSENDVDC